MGPKGAGLQYLYRDALEVGWACRGGEVVDLVELSWKVYGSADIVVYVLEACLAGEKRSHVLEYARTEVVHADDLVAFGEEPLAEVAPDETSPSRNHRPRPSGSRASPCHSHVRSPCTGALPPVRLQHRGRYGRPR